jgi:hypothetical protein
MLRIIHQMSATIHQIIKENNNEILQPLYLV